MKTGVISVINSFAQWIRATNQHEEICAKAEQEYSEIVGRFDVPLAVPGHELEDVTPEDEEHLRELGAIQSDGGGWVVPKGLDLEPFYPWWPKVPHDLRDTTPRMQRTRSGKLIEAYVLPEDQGKGQDSTATSFMFAALPVIAALGWAFSLIHLALGVFALLAAVPYLIAIKQGEGAWVAAKSMVFLLILPFVLTLIPSTAGLSVSGGHGLMNPAAVGAIWAGLTFGLGAALLTGGVGFIVLLVLFIAKWIDRGFGAAVEVMWTVLKFVIAIALIVGISMALGEVPVVGGSLKLLCIFVIFSAYPLVYANDNYVDRAVRLDAQSKMFNLGTQGVLSDAHVEARRTQAELAVRDKSPLIEIGTATGYVTEKQYAYAPDKHAKLMLSLRDMTTHTLVFGKTGAGKTACLMRPIAYMVRKTMKAGALILDGKATLVDEISSLMDFVVKPGVNLGLIDGMTATDVSTAFAQSIKGSSNGKDSVWENGANLLQQHATTIVEALCQQERAIKAYRFSKVEQFERELRWLELECDRKSKLGEAIDGIEDKIKEIRSIRNSWLELAMTPRKWPWTVSSIARFLNLMNNLVPVDRDVWEFGPEIKEAFALLGWNLPPDSPRHHHPQSIHPDIGRHGPLDASLIYLTTDWLTMAPEQRSSFFLNVTNLIQPLLRGAKLTNDQGIPWHMIEKGEDVTRCLRGEFVGVDLPEVQFGEAGRLVANLVKQRIYAEVKKRKGEESVWPEGHLPVMVMIDEAQLLVGDEERKLLPIARSLGMMAVFATQTIEGLLAQFRVESDTNHFCQTLQNTVCLDTSIATLEFVSRRLGHAELVLYKSPTIGLDYAGGVVNLAKAAMSDQSHPSRSALRLIERRGGGQFEIAVPALRGHNQNQWRELRDIKSVEDAAAMAHVKVPVGGVKEMQPVLSVEEMNALLRAKGTAVVILNRAGTPRVDVVKLNHMSEAEARKLPRIARSTETPTNQEKTA